MSITALGGDGLVAAEVESIFDRFCDAEYEKDLLARLALHSVHADEHDLPRSSSQRRHDAIVAIFRSAAASDGAGSAADLVLNIVVDADTSSLSRRRCETSSGVALHPHDVLRAALSGHVRRVVTDSANVVTDQGRKRRLFTGSSREAAMMLLRTCEHPGCRLPARFSQVDHSDEWSTDAGGTDQANAGIRCGPHNGAKSEHRWRAKRDSKDRGFTIRQDGTIMLPVGARPPDLDGRCEQPADRRDPAASAPSDDVDRAARVRPRSQPSLVGIR